MSTHLREMWRETAQRSATNIRVFNEETRRWEDQRPPVRCGPITLRAVEGLARKFQMAEEPDISRPGGILRSKADDWMAKTDAENIGFAMDFWRSSFAISMAMRAILEGRTPAPAYAQDTNTHFAAYVLGGALQRGTVGKCWRVQPGDPPGVGDRVDFSVRAVAMSRSDALPFRGGIFSDGRSHDCLYQIGAGAHGVMFPDGREGIVTGQFTVESVEEDAEFPGLSVVTVRPSGASALLRTATGDEMRRRTRRQSALSQIKIESPTPLDYRGKFWGTSKRFYITDDAAGEPGRWDTYFKDSPRDGFTAPTDPDTVAWLDIFEDNGPGRMWVYIAFIAVRDAYRGTGLGSRLIAHLYATYPQARIEWGSLVGDRTPKMYQKYKRTHPDQTGGGSAW